MTSNLHAPNNLVPRRWTEHTKAAWHVPGPRARLAQGTTIRLQHKALQAQREEKRKERRRKKERKRGKKEKRKGFRVGSRL